MESEEYVPLPKGNVHKTKEVFQELRLHDLDIANATPQGGQDLMSVVNKLNKTRKVERGL